MFKDESREVREIRQAFDALAMQYRVFNDYVLTDLRKLWIVCTIQLIAIVLIAIVK